MPTDKPASSKKDRLKKAFFLWLAFFIVSSGSGYIFSVNELFKSNMDHFTVIVFFFFITAFIVGMIITKLGNGPGDETPLSENYFHEQGFSENNMDVIIKRGLWPYLVMYMAAFYLIMPIGMIFGEGSAVLAFIQYSSFFSFFMLKMYNKQSDFEKDRVVLASFTGTSRVNLPKYYPGGFKILVYSDGIEIRTIPCIYFAPYNQISKFEHKNDSSIISFEFSSPSMPPKMILDNKNLKKMDNISEIINIAISENQSK
jgi:hypothetical protein